MRRIFGHAFAFLLGCLVAVGVARSPLWGNDLTLATDTNVGNTEATSEISPAFHIVKIPDYTAWAGSKDSIEVIVWSDREGFDPTLREEGLFR